MTCIVGIETDEGVILGADSFSGTDSYALLSKENAKVFKHKNGYVIGVAGSARYHDVLRFVVDFKKPPFSKAAKDLDLKCYEWMVKGVIPAVRKAVVDQGLRPSASDESTDDDTGVFLVGFYGRLFDVDDSFAVERAACCFAAIGCPVGAAAARGAMHALSDSCLPPKQQWQDELLRIALETSEKISSFVRRPFVFVSESDYALEGGKGKLRGR